MDIVLLTNEQRLHKFYDLSTLPEHYQLHFGGFKPTQEFFDSVNEKAAGLLANTVVQIDRTMIESMPNLKIIQTEGVAYNHVDIETARERGIYVCNQAGANAHTVAEQTILLILSVMKRVVEGHNFVMSGKQFYAKEYYILAGLKELSSCEVGLLGFGSIGREVAKRLAGFGCRIYYHSRRRLAQEDENKLGVVYLEKEDLLKRCDIVSIHLPVTKDTVNYLAAKEFAMMKNDAILINAARGEILNQDDLANALTAGQLGGFGADVLYPEPTGKDNVLLNLPESVMDRVVFSAHVGGSSLNVFLSIHKNIWANFAALETGKRPANIVNGL